MDVTHVKFVGCARCDGDGHALDFVRFERPIVAGDHTFDYWALCPVTGEPILLEVTDVQPQTPCGSS